MTAAINVSNVNAVCPKYPITVEDKGWVYGVWYCGKPFRKARLYGEYPATFLKRALALFPTAERILHCPSGTLEGVPGVTVDMFQDEVRKPQIVASAYDLPFDNETFDLILSDPPYSNEDAKKYGVDSYSMPKAMKEFYRVLQVGGYLGTLHTYYPAYHRKKWKLRALIAVVTGFNCRTRMFSVLEKL